MKTRKTIQLISLLLFPITIYYFSPIIIIDGITEGVVTGSFILFGLLFFTSIFTGRLFCSTICPAGAVQDLMMDIKNKPVKRKKISISKWIIFAIWIAIIIYLLFEFKLNKIDLLYQTKYGISVYEPGGYIILYGVLGIFMILAQIFGNRGGCHTICWMSPFMILGSKLGRQLNIPSYRLSKTDNVCISCGKCDKACPMGIKIEENIKKEKLKYTECISCAKCVEACPKNVLKMTFSRQKW